MFCIRWKGFGAPIIKRITFPVLEQTALIANDFQDILVRQDDKGVMPTIKFYRCLSTQTALSFDHESTVAMAYAFLGQCLDAAFRSDMQEVFFGSNTRIFIGAPKPFQRMQNKLLNPKEHGDASLARPRCAMNLDVLRGCIVVETIQELESTFRKLQSTYKVVRAENTHDPSEHGRNSSKKRS